MRNGANIFDLYRQVQLKESEILERTLTDAEKEKLKKLEKEVPMKDFKDRYGKEGESVYYATLTKMAKDEGFASDAQRRAAFAQGYKAKGKKGKKEETELDEAKYEVQYTISSRVGDSRSRMRSKLFKMDVDARNKEDAEKKFYKIVNKTPNLKSAADRDMLDVPYIGLKETLDEKFTKKDFDKNEDENRHTENAIELVKMFGTSAEDIKVNAIAARHNMKGSIDRKDQQVRDALVKKYYPKLKEEVEINEDGHQDVASAIRQCKTITEDAMQILQKLQTMSPEDALPTWWTNKLAVASNSMNKMRDYILVPSDGVQEKLDKEDEPKVKEIVKKLKKASDAHAGQAKDLEKAVKENLTSKELLDNKYKEEKNGAQHFSKVNEDNYVWNFVYDDFGRTKLTTEPDKATHLVYTMEGKDNPQLLKLSEREILDYKKGENK